MSDQLFTIEGYADAVSAPQGGEIGLHVSTTAERFDIEVYREGLQSRLMTRIADVAGKSFPIPENAYAEGCGWPESYRLAIPKDWPSGAYRARLVISRRWSSWETEMRGATPEHMSHWAYQKSSRPSAPAPTASGNWFSGWGEETYEHQVFFIVWAAEPGSTSPILIEICTNTYAAYNPWGGRSLYDYNSLQNKQSKKVSLNRPGVGYYGDSRFRNWELPFIKWAESNGIPLEYASNCDLERVPGLLESYKLMLSVGHDEYWSAPMRKSLDAFLAKGGNAAIFSGNSVCWQVRLEDDGRAIVCYRDTSDPAHATDPHLTTTRYDDPAIGCPSNGVIGVGWEQGGYHRSHGVYMDGSGAYTVKRPDHWVFAGTGLKAGDEFGGASTIVGYETDGCLFEVGPDGLPYPTGADGTPKDYLILAQAPAGHIPEEDGGRGHLGTACMGIYEHAGTVFNAATTDWAHGLADDGNVQRITRNVIERLSGEKF